jgi:hypothetical protein
MKAQILFRQRFMVLFFLGTLLAGCAALPQADEPSPADPQETLPVETDLVDRSNFEESDDPPYVIEARWPNLAGNAAFAGPFNTGIDHRVDDGLADFMDAVRMPGGDEEFPGLSTLTLDYEVRLISDGLVSVYLMWDTYIALSAHAFPSSQALNYDAIQGHFLTLADRFGDEVDLQVVILERVEPELLSRDLGYTAGVAEQVLEVREHWNLLPEGLRINFDVYEVGSYAAGPQFVLIPWEDLAPYLQAEGQFGLGLQAGL